jgi:hypothetical protein
VSLLPCITESCPSSSLWDSECVSSSFELWFPAVIRLQNPDGKYQIEYSTKIWMSWILLPPKRYLSGSKPYTVATVILTKLVMITKSDEDADYDEDSYDDK